jgi:hypothetical protein
VEKRRFPQCLGHIQLDIVVLMANIVVEFTILPSNGLVLQANSFGFFALPRTCKQGPLGEEICTSLVGWIFARPAHAKICSEVPVVTAVHSTHG